MRTKWAKKERKNTTTKQQVTTYISPYYVRLSNREFEENWKKKEEERNKTKQKQQNSLLFVDNKAECVCMFACDALLFGIVKQSLCYCSTERSHFSLWIVSLFISKSKIHFIHICVCFCMVCVLHIHFNQLKIKFNNCRNDENILDAAICWIFGVNSWLHFWFGSRINASHT